MHGIDAEAFECKRFAYLSGPAPVEQFLREMQAGMSSYFGTNYMKQFLQLIEDCDARADIVAWHDGPETVRTMGRFTICNRHLSGGSGLSYHVLMVAWHLRVLFRWLRYRPDIVVVTGNQDYWWVLSPLRLLGAQIIPSYHSTLWPKLQKRKPHKAWFTKLNAWSVLKGAPAIVTTSADIADQVKQAIGPERADRIVEHLPTYDRSQFRGMTPVEKLPEWPFHVVYTGRMEENKGVFDLLNAAAKLNRDRPGAYHLHFCGDGTQATRFRQEVDEAKLNDAVTYHGFCEPSLMKAIIDRAHVAVVPTRSDFEAGFEMTCCEAVLCGRPLIASTACPALHYLEGASIAVTPDSAGELHDAIRSVSEDRALFQRLANQCDDMAEQFYDPENSWTYAMRQALSAVRERTVRRHAAVR